MNQQWTNFHGQAWNSAMVSVRYTWCDIFLRWNSSAIQETRNEECRCPFASQCNLKVILFPCIRCSHRQWGVSPRINFQQFRLCKWGIDEVRGLYLWNAGCNGNHCDWLPLRVTRSEQFDKKDVIHARVRPLIQYDWSFVWSLRLRTESSKNQLLSHPCNYLSSTILPSHWLQIPVASHMRSLSESHVGEELECDFLRETGTHYNVRCVRVSCYTLTSTKQVCNFQASL